MENIHSSRSVGIKSFLYYINLLSFISFILRDIWQDRPLFFMCCCSCSFQSSATLFIFGTQQLPQWNQQLRYNQLYCTSNFIRSKFTRNKSIRNMITTIKVTDTRSLNFLTTYTTTARHLTLKNNNINLTSCQ